MTTVGSFEADAQAPVFASGEIQIAAPPEVVWDVVANVDQWPEWNPGVSDVSLDGPISPGTTFNWKAGRSKIVSRFERVDRPRSVGWTGRTLGIPAIHVWKIEQADTGSRLSTQESWGGWLTRLLRRKLQAMLDEAVQKGLQATKTEAERRALKTV